MNTTLSELSIYDWPAEMEQSSHFSVTLNGQDVPVCATGVAAFLVVAFEGTVEFEVTVESSFKNASLRPLSRNLAVQVEGRTVRFQLERPDNLSLEIDGLMPLFIFANAIETARPDANDSSVHFFAAGQTHEVGELEISSGETVYIEGGAVVRGAITSADATNISILGHGVLDGSVWKHNDNAHRSIQWEKCTDVLLEDIVMIHPSTWMVTAALCDRIQIRNLKQIGECVSSDGIDVVGSQNVLIEDCFLLNNDDCIAVKSHYGHHPHARYEDWRGDVRHVEVRDCTFLNARAGNVMEIGFELQTDSICDITFRNIDVLSGHGEGGVFTIHNGDNATVSHILWEDIRVEHFYDKLIDFRILNSRYSGDLGRGQIRNVHLKKIRVVEDIYNSPSLIGGYDEDHTVEGVMFEDFFIGNKAVTSADDLHLFQKHAKDIRFKAN
ncbi:MAG TPA: glycosyl hydrolase family 28 protein [Abditibacteriaceae bacterium]